MKLKFKQSVATAKATHNVGQVYDIEDEKQAKSFIEAGIAEEVKEEKPSKETDKKVENVEQEQPKRKRQPKASEK